MFPCYYVFQKGKLNKTQDAVSSLYEEQQALNPSSNDTKPAYLNPFNSEGLIWTRPMGKCDPGLL